MAAKYFNLFFTVLLCSLATAGCKKDDVAGTSIPGLPTDPEDGNPGVVDSTGGFNIKVNKPLGTNYYIHLKDDFDSKCVVASTETSAAAKDIICTLEVEELEGKFHGLEMVLNVPPSMCKYVAHLPYYYFGENYGTAPTSATIRTTTAGVVTGTVTPPTAGDVSGGGELTCTYDYSSGGGPNCCIGKTNIIRTINFGSVDPEQPQTTTTETKDWAGLPGNCAAGGGLASAARNKTTNMPIPTLYYSLDGFSQSFASGSSLLLADAESYYFANYVTGSTFPLAFKVGVSDPFKGNPYYSWVCYDDALEINAQIRVEVRDWNQESEFLLESSGDPDTVGSEPVWGAPINDWLDWDDNLNGLDSKGTDSFPGMPL